MKTNVVSRDSNFDADGKKYTLMAVSALETPNEDTGIIIAMSNHNAQICQGLLKSQNYDNVLIANLFDE